MTVVANFFNRLAKALPVLILKIGTFLLLIFTVGMFAGYAIAVMNITPIIFLIPIVAMLIMWYKLDEGVFILILLTLLVIFFPDAVNSFISTIL
jgi:hypothetical protein